MSKHTQGPWFIGDANIPAEYTHGIHAGDFIVADLCDDAHTPKTRKANARLIAAAPELLEALKAAVAFIESHAADPDITQEMCEKYAAYLDSNPSAAIAKAEGEQ